MVDPANPKQAKKHQKVKHIPEYNEGKFKIISEVFMPCTYSTGQLQPCVELGLLPAQTWLLWDSSAPLQTEAKQQVWNKAHEEGIPLQWHLPALCAGSEQSWAPQVTPAHS